MPEDFSENLIKASKHWEIYVADNQGYLGRCVLWCKREDALELTDATPEEQVELFLVLGDLKRAAKRAFQADWFNYSFLGNGVRHLHGHFIPRYATPRTFMGFIFEDKLWGQNYRTDHSFVTPDELRNSVRDRLEEALKAK